MINYNKISRESISEEENNAVYEKKSEDLNFLKDSDSKFVHHCGRRILVDKDEVLPFVRIRVRKGYIECGVSKMVDRKSVYQSIGRFILGVTDKSLTVDHINGNTLDNRKGNLRVCSQSENLANRKTFSNKNKYKGLCFNKRGGIVVQLQKNGIRYSVYAGVGKDEYAAKIYDVLALKYHGEFADLNMPKELYTPEFIKDIEEKIIVKVKDRTSRLAKSK